MYIESVLSTEEKNMSINPSIRTYMCMYTHVCIHSHTHAHTYTHRKLSSEHRKTPNIFIDYQKVKQKQIKNFISKRAANLVFGLLYLISVLMCFSV